MKINSIFPGNSQDLFKLPFFIITKTHITLVLSYGKIHSFKTHFDLNKKCSLKQPNNANYNVSRYKAEFIWISKLKALVFFLACDGLDFSSIFIRAQLSLISFFLPEKKRFCCIFFLIKAEQNKESAASVIIFPCDSSQAGFDFSLHAFFLSSSWILNIYKKLI